MILRLLKAWKNILFSPDRIKDDDFSLKEMVVVSFILGFIYIFSRYLFHFELGQSGFIEELSNIIFWLHCLYGAFAALGILFFTPMVGYFTIRKLGKNISYKRIEQLVFSAMFLFLIPNLISYIFRFRLLRFAPYFKMAESMVFTSIIASVMTFFIFYRAFKFNVIKSFFAGLLIVPVSYFLTKGSLNLICWNIGKIIHGVPLWLHTIIGDSYILVIILICFFIRRKYV